MTKILYVCSSCYEHANEICGWTDHRELAVMPDGSWLCETCAGELEELRNRGVAPKIKDGGEIWPKFGDFSHPPEYGPKS